MPERPPEWRVFRSQVFVFFPPPSVATVTTAADYKDRVTRLSKIRASQAAVYDPSHLDGHSSASAWSRFLEMRPTFEEHLVCVG